MHEARLKFNGREFVLGDAVVTCGRGSDNTIAFTEDSNVSRYHVEIDPRGGDYWIIDLNSSNGTTVNGEKLSGEQPLNEGDRIVLGGSSELQFTRAANETAAEKPNESAAGGAGAMGSAPGPPAAAIPNAAPGGIAT